MINVYFMIAKLRAGSLGNKMILNRKLGVKCGYVALV